MSYTVTLYCGCEVYVSCHPHTGIAHTRVVERRGAGCTVRKHDIGVRIWLWEMLPDDRRPMLDHSAAAAGHSSFGLKL